MAKEIKRGQFYSINNKKVFGHRGRVVSVKKNKVKLVAVTHSKEIVRKKKIKGLIRIRKEKTIPLLKNPNPSDAKKAYVVKRPILANKRQIGKHYSNMSVTNAHDKSIFRKVGRKKIKKK